jgi:hypothetical protein
LALLAFVALPVVCADAQLAQTPADFAPVADVTSLMTGLGTAFGKIKDLTANPEEDRRLPQLVAWSGLAAELSNINTLHGTEQPYRDMAVTTRDIALELAQAAQADTVDEGQLTSLVIQLDTSCSTCHDSDY